MLERDEQFVCLVTTARAQRLDLPERPQLAQVVPIWLLKT